MLIWPGIKFSLYLNWKKIDLVNLNNSIKKNHEWILASILAGKKCITHEMGINQSFTNTAIRFGKKLDAIISVSHAIHDNIKRLGINWDHIYTVQNGIDLTRYELHETPQQLKTKYNVPKGAPVIGVLGNIRRWKGQETVVRAVPKIKEKFPDVRCFLVGAVINDEDGKKFEKLLFSLIKKFNISKNVIFTGFQNNPLDYINLLDVFIHSSIDPEPFGIVNLEAMYMKKPIISTTIGGPVEIFVNGESAVLIEPGDPVKLADTVVDLIKHPQKASKMGEAGYERLFKKFTLEKMVNNTVKIYNKVLGS